MRHFCPILLANTSIIFSQEYAYQLSADDNLTQLDTHPVGTGPYQVKDYVYNQYVRLVRNEDYWKKKLKLKYHRGSFCRSHGAFN